MNKILFNKGEASKEPNRNPRAEQYNDGTKKFNRRLQQQTQSTKRKNQQTGTPVIRNYAIRGRNIKKNKK